ncbi:MAG: type 4a pilus biogenesis protein PilO [Deltaproteobacteria bacterium]|jgi:Tfp pilus assembly protein PilO|nr:type 4a pilus biogenesis protein PilO [Deltaproteobacteria bacterium]
MAKAQAQKQKKGPDFFTKIAGLKKQAKLAILVLSVIAAGAAFYMLYYTPWLESKTALEGELGNLASSIQSEQTNINKHKPIAQYILPVNNTFSYLKTYLTTENEIPKLISIISDLGQRAGARVTLFAPRAAIPRTDYAEIQFTMNLEGTFLNVLKFFYSLSQMERLINITSVNMNQPRMTENHVMVLNVNCEGSTYRLLTSSEIEAQKAAPQK